MDEFICLFMPGAFSLSNKTRSGTVDMSCNISSSMQSGQVIMRLEEFFLGEIEHRGDLDENETGHSRFSHV